MRLHEMTLGVESDLVNVTMFYTPTTHIFGVVSLPTVAYKRPVIRVRSVDLTNLLTCLQILQDTQFRYPSVTAADVQSQVNIIIC